MKYGKLIFSLLLISVTTVVAQEESISKLEKDIQEVEGQLAEKLDALDALYISIYQKKCEHIGFPKYTQGSKTQLKFIHNRSNSMCMDPATQLPYWIMRFIPNKSSSFLSGMNARSTDNKETDKIRSDKQLICQDLFEISSLMESKIAIDDHRRTYGPFCLRKSFVYQKGSDLQNFVKSAVKSSENGLFLIYGAIIEQGMEEKKIGNDEYSIPFSIYVILIDLSKGSEKSLAFVLPNAGSGNKLQEFAMSVDEFEAMINIDIAPNLPIEIQEKIESGYDVDDWILNTTSDSEEVNLSNSIGSDPVAQWPNDAVFTNQLSDHMDTYCKVCGLVASTHKTSSNRVFLNIDKAYPEQPFSATIMSDGVETFPYDPSVFLKGKKVCLRGKLKMYRDKPSMIINGVQSLTIIQP